MFRFTKNYLLVGGFALLMASSKQVNAQKTKDKEKDKQEQTPSQPKIGTGIPSGTTLFPTKNSDDDWHMAALQGRDSCRRLARGCRARSARGVFWRTRPQAGPER